MVWVLLIDAALVLAFWAVSKHWVWITNHLGNCVFRQVTGLYCPGCGGTRMVRDLLHGDFFSAPRYNPLLFSLVLYLAVAWILYHVFAFSGRAYYRAIVNRRALWLILCVTLVFALTRNIPVRPFTWLSP